MRVYHIHTCMFVFMSICPIYGEPGVHTSTSNFSLILHGSFRFFSLFIPVPFFSDNRNLLPIICKYLFDQLSFPLSWSSPHSDDILTRCLCSTPSSPSQAPSPHTRPPWLSTSAFLPSARLCRKRGRKGKTELLFKMFLFLCVYVCVCIYTLCVHCCFHACPSMVRLSQGQCSAGLPCVVRAGGGAGNPSSTQVSRCLDEGGAVCAFEVPVEKSVGTGCL